MRTALALFLVFVARVVSADDLVWENDTARLVLTSKGEFRVLVNKATTKEYAPAKASPFVTVLKDGQQKPATSAVRSGEVVDFGFGEPGMTARLRITSRPLYFLVELISVEPNSADVVEFASAPTRIKEHVGGVLNATWNDEFVVCVMGLSPNVEARSRAAFVHRKFGINPARAAILALPPERFYEAVQRVEQDQGLPSPTLGGQWAKTSEDARRSYLFVDLTEANVDEAIRWAKLGGFGYILTYVRTWSASRGTFPIDTRNFPSGEAGLKAVADKCHAAGLKMGLHIMPGFVDKRDPLVTPRPDPRLIKDRLTALAADISEKDATIPATDSVAGWPAQPSINFRPNCGLDIQIDDEIIAYTIAGGPDGKTFVQCQRGLHGTRPARHAKGAKIEHLGQRHGLYYVDWRTSLKEDTAERLAGVVNRCGLDMLYFDSGGANDVVGPELWYWTSVSQQAVWQRLRREVLVEGAGRTHWTWHFYTRGVCGDFASVSPKTYLDHEKLHMWENYRDSFLPGELGWWGLEDYGPDRPATTPDEVELHAVRMIALDSPIGMETYLAALKDNARAEEMVRLLGCYEQVRLARKVPPALRERLRQGEWRMELRDGKPVFRPVSYDTLRLEGAGAVMLRNRFDAQPLAFRLRAEPKLANPGDSANRVLFRPSVPLTLEPPASAKFLPGRLANRVEFAQAVGDQPNPELVGETLKPGGGRVKGNALDLTAHRALAVRLEVEGATPRAGEPCPVLNVQLESASRMYRDHYIDLDFRGTKTIVLPGPTTDRLLPEFRPPIDVYYFKHAMMRFDYKRVAALNFRWMRTGGLRVLIHSVEALRESDALLRNPALTVGDTTFTFPVELRTGDYAEFSGTGEVRVFDRNGKLRSKPVKPLGESPLLQPGSNQIRMSAEESCPVNLTVITLGKPEVP